MNPNRTTITGRKPNQTNGVGGHAQVDLPHGKKVSLTTNPSKKPSGADANFLERLTVPLELPVEDIFAPRLKLCVRDVRLGG